MQKVYFYFDAVVRRPQIMNKVNCFYVISKATWIHLKQGLILSEELRIVEIFRSILHYIIHIFMLSILVLNINNGIKSQNVSLVNRMVCLLIPVSNLIAKALTLQKNRKCFLRLLEDLQSDAFNTHSEKSNTHIQFVDKIRALMLKYFMITIGVFLLVGSVLPVIINIDLLIPNPIRDGRYEVIYRILHFIGTTYFGFNSGCFDVLYVSLIAMCIAQLKILEEELVNIVGNSSEREFIELGNGNLKERLKQCVVLHVTIDQ